MASKWFKNDWSIAGFLLFWTEFAWAILILTIIMYSISFLIDVFTSGPMGLQDLPVRIRIQDLTEVFVNSESANIFQNSILQTNASAVGINELKNQWSYYLASAMALGLDYVMLYGLTLLKRIFRSLKHENPWDDQNSKNLRLIGYLMVAAVPYKYVIGWLSYLTFQQIQLPDKVSLFWPPFAWEVGLAGLAIILVAYIFEEGTRIYKEQELTV